jgi:hypothetical protein
MKKLARFNWYILLACALVFAAGGTLFGIAAIIFSGHVLAWMACIGMCTGLYFAAGMALYEMERC